MSSRFSRHTPQIRCAAPAISLCKTETAMDMRTQRRRARGRFESILSIFCRRAASQRNRPPAAAPALAPAHPPPRFTLSSVVIMRRNRSGKPEWPRQSAARYDLLSMNMLNLNHWLSHCGGWRDICRDDECRSGAGERKHPRAPSAPPAQYASAYRVLRDRRLSRQGGALMTGKRNR